MAISAKGTARRKARVRKALKALLALFAVIFCVDLHAGAVLLAAAVDAVIRQLLDGVERFAATADQRAELFTFEEDLVAALLTLVDLDLSGGVHVLKKALEERAFCDLHLSSPIVGFELLVFRNRQEHFCPFHYLGILRLIKLSSFRLVSIFTDFYFL